MQVIVKQLITVHLKNIGLWRLLESVLYVTNTQVCTGTWDHPLLRMGKMASVAAEHLEAQSRTEVCSLPQRKVQYAIQV